MPPERPAHPRPPLPPLLGRPLEPFFRAGVALRNVSFDRGFRVTRLPIPIISVGNLSVGGTGKTPFVRWVVRVLLDAGRHPAIALRGYTPRAGDPSDEQQEYAERYPDVPLALGVNRAATLSQILTIDRIIDCAVLDDAFQHRYLARDLDIVLLDATRDPFAERCLPAGWLREPVSSLRRAHAIVITHAESAPPAVSADIRRRAAIAAPRAILAVARHAWTQLDSAAAPRPVDWLRGRRVHAMCAIGNPSAFLAQITAAAATVASTDLRRDHAAYTPRDVESALAAAQRSNTDAILTTAKDWVKLAPLTPENTPIPFLRPRLEIAFDEGEAALRQAILAVANAAPARASIAANTAAAPAPVLR